MRGRSNRPRALAASGTALAGAAIDDYSPGAGARGAGRGLDHRDISASEQAQIEKQTKQALAAKNGDGNVTDKQSKNYRAQTRKGGKNALNIWLVDFDYLGIATFPWDYKLAPGVDGIRVH